MSDCVCVNHVISSEVLTSPTNHSCVDAPFIESGEVSYFWKFHLISSFDYKVIEAVRLASCIGKCDMHGKNSIVCSVTSTVYNYPPKGR